MTYFLLFRKRKLQDFKFHMNNFSLKKHFPFLSAPPQNFNIK